MKIVAKIFMIIVLLTAVVGGGYLIGSTLIIFHSSEVVTVSSNHFTIQTGGTITTESNVKFEAANEQGKFCFMKEDGLQLCSKPAPRPNNAIAHSLSGEFTPGTWKLISAESRVGVQSEQNIGHCDNNLGGFIGLCVLFGLIYLALLYQSIKCLIITIKS